MIDISGASSSLFNSALNTLFPSFCPICNSPSNNYKTSPICNDCWKEIKPIEGYTCGICKRPVESADIQICAECYRERPLYLRAMAFGFYEGILREAIHLYKFSQIKRLVKPISALMYNLDVPDVDFIVPVPLTKERLKKRGFNQSLLLANNLSKKFGISLSSNLLIKVKETEYQSLLGRKDRLMSLKGAFNTKERIDNMKVIIVDDVTTTGTTLNECSRALLKAGAKEVYSIIIARARM